MVKLGDGGNHPAVMSASVTRGLRRVTKAEAAGKKVKLGDGGNGEPDAWVAGYTGEREVRPDREWTLDEQVDHLVTGIKMVMGDVVGLMGDIEDLGERPKEAHAHEIRMRCIEAAVTLSMEMRTLPDFDAMPPAVIEMARQFTGYVLGPMSDTGSEV